MKKHSVMIAGHATSFSLEDAFWEALKACAQRQNVSISSLVAQVDANRTEPLSSALRIYLLNNAQQAQKHHT